MNLVAVVDEIFAVLGAAGIDLNVPDDGPGVRAAPPAPYVQLPGITYGAGGPGLHRITDLELMIVFGQATNRHVFRSALEYASTEGPRSITAALDAHTWVSCGTLFVREAEPVIETIGAGNPQIAYSFHIDITGG